MTQPWFVALTGTLLNKMKLLLSNKMDTGGLSQTFWRMHQSKQLLQSLRKMYVPICSYFFYVSTILITLSIQDFCWRSMYALKRKLKVFLKDKFTLEANFWQLTLFKIVKIHTHIQHSNQLAQEIGVPEKQICITFVSRKFWIWL